MNNFRHKIHEIIFEADTPAGKIFDLSLLILILLSVLAVMLESVDSLRNQYQSYFDLAEWTFTIIFSLEYVLRHFPQIISMLNDEQFQA